MRSYGHNIALQGEIIGEGIQKNPEKIKGQDFYLFDIWDINQRRYYSPQERRALHEKFFSALKHIPVLDVKRYLTEYQSVESILATADGTSMKGEVREGIVFRSNESGLTFKVISNLHLLAE